MRPLPQRTKEATVSQAYTSAEVSDLRASAIAISATPFAISSMARYRSNTTAADCGKLEKIVIASMIDRALEMTIIKWKGRS